MKKIISKKTLYIISAALLLIFSFYFIFKERRVFSAKENYIKEIVLNDDGLIFTAKTEAKTVGELLIEKNIELKERDVIFPDKESFLFPGTNIRILRARKLTFAFDGKTIEKYTLAKDVRGAISENNITLGKLDKTEPALDDIATVDSKITITRIDIEEKIIKEDIDFKTITKEDSKMGWRETKVKQKGEKGVLEVKYKITYKNGKEISREKISSERIKEPIDHIITQGTYVKLGKKHTGLGTWYRQPSHLFIGSASGEGMYAANPWLPKGSYVKVVNNANGKSVIVRINDRGPFGENRIIDLNYAAFAKIASVGAGVIDVKMYEIEN